MVTAASGSDFGVDGFLAEPAAGFRHARHRDRALAAFCSVVWQTHTAHRRPTPRPWPSREALKANLPGISFDLIVAASKIEEAAEDIPRERPAEGEAREHWLFGTAVADAAPNGNVWQRRRHEAMPTSELAEDLLDPPPVPEQDWHDVFAAELASHPAIAGDLAQPGPGDGVELVLERAGLTASERLVIRGWLAGDDAATIAADLRWRPQTVIMLLTNARIRLEDVVRWSKPRTVGRKPGAPTELSAGGYEVASSAGAGSGSAGG